MARLQQLGFERPVGESLGVNGSEWFEKSTARIDLISEVERSMAKQIGDYARQAHIDARNGLLFAVAMVIAAVALVCCLSWLIIRNINHAGWSAE